LDNGNFLVAYRDANDSYKGKLQTYNSSGVQVVAAVTFETGHTKFINAALLGNTNVFIVYQDVSNYGKGKFVIYDEDGNEVVAPTEFETGNTEISCNPVLLNNNNVFVPYVDKTDSSKGKFVIYDEDGNEVVAPTVFETDSIRYTNVVSAVKCKSGDVIIAWEKEYSDGGYYSVYTQNGTVINSNQEFETVRIEFLWANRFSNGLIALSYRQNVSKDGVLNIFNVIFPPSDMITYKRLVAAAANTFWYEDI